MKAAEIRDKSIDELRSLQAELRDEYFRLRMQHYTGQLEQPTNLKKTRRAIARVETVLNERLRADA